MPLDIAQPLRHKTRPHVVDIKAQLARCQPLAFCLFRRQPLVRLIGDLCRCGAGHHADAIVIGHDHIAGLHQRAAADDGDIDRAQGLLHRALRRDGRGPDAKAHRPQIPRVAHMRRQ